jgi:hypothetical protein
MLLDTFKEYLDILWGTSQDDLLKYIGLVLTLILLVMIFRKSDRR